MNLLLLEKKEILNNNNFLIQGRKYHHLIEILKVKKGDNLISGILNGKKGNSKVIDIIEDEKKLIVDFNEISGESKKGYYLHLISSYQRPQTTKKILQLASTWGVDSIEFYLFSKTEKSYKDSSIWKNENYREEIILGLEQGKRTISPEIILSNTYYPLKDRVPEGELFLLDINGVSFFHYSNNLNKAKRINLCIGPESGLIEKDIEFFRSIGFNLIKLSESTLRSEFALAFSLGQIELCRSMG